MLNVYVCVYGSRYVQLDLYPLYSVSYVSADHVLVPRAGTSFVQCFAWSAKRGQMCLVCPTPCAVCLGITGAEHTRPCWCLFRTGQMCLVCPTLCAVRLGITGAEHTRPCWCIFRTGPMCLVCPTLCAVRLGITGAEHTRPCWCFVLVSLSCSASLGLYSA